MCWELSKKKLNYFIFSLFISFDLKMKFISMIVLMGLIVWIFNLDNSNFFINTFSSKAMVAQFLQKENKTNSFVKSRLNSEYLLIVFFTIANLNLAGLLTFSFTVMSHLCFIFFFSISFWLSINASNLVNKLDSYFAHMTPAGSPLGLSFFLVIIETISNIIRPLTLVIRLMANLTAGHLIMILCANGYLFMGFLSIPLIFISMLEIMVCLIQAYVFMTLISMYRGEL